VTFLGQTPEGAQSIHIYLALIANNRQAWKTRQGQTQVYFCCSISHEEKCFISLRV